MTISKAKRKAVYEASSGRCAYCGCVLNLNQMTIDHVYPKSACSKDERADDVSNLVCCCKVCNTTKAAMTVKEFRKFVATRNAELLKLEDERLKALAKVNRLTSEIEGHRFAYIRYLRKNRVIPW